MKKRSLNWKKPAATLRQTCARYFELRQATWQPRTIRHRRYTVLRFVAFIETRYPQVKHFAELRRHPQVEAWLESIRHLHPVTRRGYIAILDQFFQDLIEWEWTEAPPRHLLQSTDFPPLPQRLPKPFAPEEDRRLRQILEQQQSVMGLGVRLLRETGLRVGELLGLPLDAARLNREGHYELHVPPGKTHAERIFPLTPQTFALIEAIRQRRGMQTPHRPLPALLMIDEQGQPVRYWTCRRYIKKLARQADFAHWEQAHLHQLRHTFATELARTEMPLPSLMHLLGHKRPDITMRYVQLTNRDIRHTYEKALAQLPSLHNLNPGVSPKASLADTTLREDFEALIARLDHHRRDRHDDPAAAQALARLVKRLRAAQRAFKETP